MMDRKTKVLIDEYEAVLRVCRISTEEWFMLDDAEKAAMLAAQKRIDIERAIMMAKAMEGPEAIASMMAEVDGGDLKVKMTVSKAVDRWIYQRMKAMNG